MNEALFKALVKIVYALAIRHRDILYNAGLKQELNALNDYLING